MDKDMMQQIHDIAARFRSAIESYKPEEYPAYVSMRYGFPRGSCGEVSDLLGTHLVKLGYNNVRYVCGKRRNATHAWVEVDGVVIDISADQFEGEISEKVVVSEDGTWHKKEWKKRIIDREIIPIGKGNSFVDADKVVAYNMIVRRMNETE